MYHNKRSCMLASLLAMCSMFHYSIYSATYTVGSSGADFQDIATAVASVADGSTLRLIDASYSGSNNQGIAIGINLTIIGTGATPAIITLNNDRFCTIDATYTVTMSNLLIEKGAITVIGGNGGAVLCHGNMVAMNCTFSGNNASYTGGAICMDTSDSYLTMVGCTSFKNIATAGGAIECSVDNISFTATDCFFVENEASGDGGAVEAFGTSILNFTGCTFSNNSAVSTYGGAIYNENILTIVSCVFNANSANRSGGAIYNAGGTVFASDGCTFSNNSANLNGGAIINGGSLIASSGCIFSNNSAISRSGGAIYNTDSLTVSNCVFSGNSASANGGAIRNTGSSCQINCCRIVDNIATASGSAIYDSGSSTVDAQSNWWGSNTDPSTIPNLLVGAIDSSNWITVVLNANPAVIGSNGASTITAVFTPSCIPDGTPVAFSATTGGTMSPTLALTVGGVATSQLAAGLISSPLTVSATVGPNVEAFPLSLTLPLPSGTMTAHAQQQKNRFPLATDLANVITWDPVSASIFPDVVSYWIYAYPNLLNPIAIVNAEQPLCYVDHNRCPGTEYTYYIYAINSKGEQSEPAIVTVP